MARQFGSYSPAVPLGITWEESLVLEDESGAAIDLTGYAVRAQLRDAVPVVDDLSGEAVTDPVIEVTTPGYYTDPPAWPLVEGFSVPTPADGTILLTVAPDDTWKCSPDNAKRKLVWDIRLVNTITAYAIPVVSGKVSMLPGVTI